MKSSQNIDALIIEHLNYLHRIAFRLTGCTYSSEDIVQEMFLNLSPKDINGDNLKNPRAWLATILYRTFIKHHRKEKRNPVSRQKSVYLSEDESVLDEIACANPGPAELIDKSKLQKKLTKAIYSLSEEYRTVVVMHDVEGYTLPELQRLTNIPLGTLKSRLHRARMKLQNIIHVDEPENASPEYIGVNSEL